MGQLKASQIENNTITGASFIRDFKMYDETETLSAGTLNLRQFNGKFYFPINNVIGTTENDLTQNPSLSSDWIESSIDYLTLTTTTDYLSTEEWEFDALEFNILSDVEAVFRSDLISNMRDGAERFIFNPYTNDYKVFVKTNGLDLDDSTDTVIIKPDGYLEFKKVDGKLIIIRSKNTYRGSSTIGDGSDGDVVYSTSVVVNDYTRLTANRSSGSQSLTVADASAFSAGDEILLHQTQDANNSNAGAYEFSTIQSISTNTLVLVSPITNDYYSGTFGTIENEATQVVRVPNFNSVQLQSGGKITSTPWVSATGYGGIVVFRSKTDIIFETGNLGIDVSEQGFLGGRDNGGGNGDPGDPGESEIGFGWLNNSNTSNCDPNGSGGGGGYGPSSDSGTAGGGGGHLLSGGNAVDGNSPPALAQGGNAIGDTTMTELHFGGAGGGGGDDDDKTTPGPYGGNSAGIIYIACSTSEDTKAFANGEDGIPAGSSSGGDGGGGAGGTIYIQALTYSEDTVEANGGVGGSDSSGDIGGTGSVGIINAPQSSSAPATEFLELVKTTSQAINNGTDSYITWSFSEFITPSFSWSGSEVTINTDGVYLFQYEGTAERVSGNTRTNCNWWMELDNGSGFTVLAGTQRGSYHRQNNYSETSIPITKLLSLMNGDKIRFVAQANETSLQTLDNGCHLVVEKK